MRIEIPVFQGTTDHEQLSEMRAYLFDLVGSLNTILQNLERGQPFTNVDCRSPQDYESHVDKFTSKSKHPIDMAGQPIKNLPPPKDVNDPVTLGYIRQVIGGGR